MESPILNAIKQPAPSIASNEQNTALAEAKTKTPERKINRPKVGVVDVPNISKIPLTDTIMLKKQENPQTAYKITNKKPLKGMTMQNIASIGVGVLGFVALLSEIVKKRK